MEAKVTFKGLAQMMTNADWTLAKRERLMSYHKGNEGTAVPQPLRAPATTDPVQNRCQRGQ